VKIPGTGGTQQKWLLETSKKERGETNLDSFLGARIAGIEPIGRAKVTARKAELRGNGLVQGLFPKRRGNGRGKVGTRDAES